MNFTPNAQEVKANIEQKLSRLFGTTAADASREQMYKAVAQTVKDILAEKRSEFKARTNKEGGKRVYYIPFLDIEICIPFDSHIALYS